MSLMIHPDSIQSHIEHDEQVDRIQARLHSGEHAPDSLNYDHYEDGGELVCGDCGGPCQSHTWDKRHQLWIGECCRLPEAGPLPANYAAQQVAILEDVVGITDGRAALVDEALAHLRLVRMQSTDPLMLHVEIAERLLQQIRRAA